MKLYEVFVTINGYLVGPMMTTLPDDHRGIPIEPASGDLITLVVRPKDAPLNPLFARGKLFTP